MKNYKSFSFLRSFNMYISCILQVYFYSSLEVSKANKINTLRSLTYIKGIYVNYLQMLLYQYFVTILCILCNCYLTVLANSLSHFLYSATVIFIFSASALSWEYFSFFNIKLRAWPTLYFS